MATVEPSDRLRDALFRVKRGLSAYVSYLEACHMKRAFSEHVLYEPILRILVAAGYDVYCEHPCQGIEYSGTGDKKRLDFYAKRTGEGQTLEFAIEVKWLRKKKPDTVRDEEKLRSFCDAKPEGIALLCVFGDKRWLGGLELSKEFKERGKPVYAPLRKTTYSCRIYRFLPIKKRRK